MSDKHLVECQNNPRVKEFLHIFVFICFVIREHTLFVAVVLIMAGRWVFPKDLEEQLKPWDGKGLAIAFLLHMGPVEWIYYWAHRALHHHYLYTRYHSHHHSSFVTQPITCEY